MHRLQRVLDRLVERVDTPAPIVLVDVMQRNIDRMQGFAAEHNLDVQASRQDAQVRGDRSAPGRGRGGRDHRRQRR